MGFGESLKVELPRVADGSDSGCERMRGMKHEGGLLGREAVGGLGLEERSSALVLLKLSGDVK